VLTRALALALALSGGAARAQDGGLPAVVDVELATLHQPDGGVVLVTGGAWLRDDVLLERANNLKHPPAPAPAPATPPPPAQVVIATAVIAALAGYVGGLLTPRP
jgi:hypothetical protein